MVLSVLYLESDRNVALFLRVSKIIYNFALS